MRKFLSLLAVLVLFDVSAFAQTKVVTGRVTDQNGQAVPFATIQIKEGKQGVSADADGNFAIRANPSETLIISGTGITTQEVPVGTASFIPVAVTRTSANMTEVVVTALGIRRNKNQLPYSVQQIGGDEVSKQRSSNFVTNLEGKIAGLEINQSNSIGGSTNVILRGYKSILYDNQALFVVDGVPVDNSNTNSSLEKIGGGGYDYGNAAADINPDNIESISVLKGSAASALYGQRGFNGVILITTKKGRSGGLGVTINAGVTTGSIDKSTFPKYQREYGAGYGKYYPSPDGHFLYFDVNGDGTDDLVTPTTEDASWGAKFDPSLLVYQWDAFDKTSPYYHKARPWVAAANDPSTFFTKPFSYNTGINIQGGNEKGTFALGYTRIDDKGMLPNSHITKDLANFAGTLKLTNRLSVSASLNYTGVSGKGRYGTGYDPSNPAQNFRQWWETNVDMKELKDAYFRTGQNTTWNWADPSDEVNGLYPIFWNNPYFDRYQNYETDTRTRYLGNITANYKITDWLNVMGRVALDHYDELQEEREQIGSNTGSNPPHYDRFNHSFNDVNFDLMFNVDKDLSNSLNLKALLGGNIRRVHNQSIDIGTNGGLIIPGFYSLSNSLNPLLPPAEADAKSEVDGVFAGATLTYRKFLILDGTLRRDQSSTLPEGNNAYFYPSVSGGFVFSELLPSLTWLSYGKLRANYATVGHDAPVYATRDTYTIGSPFNGQATAYPSTTKANQNLLPEKNESYEFGIEANFLKNRLGFDVTYYHARTYNQILAVQISNASGFSSKFLNAGTMQNQGVEVSFNATPVKTENFSWDITVNYTKNVSKVISLFDTAKNIQLASFNFGVSLNATVGRPYGEMRGTDYVYTDGKPTVATSGFYRVSANSNNVIGNANPDWSGSVSNTFRYKNISLGFLIDTRQGGDIFSQDMTFGLSTGLYPETAGKNDLGNPVRNTIADGGGIIYKGVTADGKDNTKRVDISGQNGAFGFERNPNKAFVYDASFVKLREASITYSLPATIISKMGPFKGIDISVIGRNLWIIHKNLPYSDPEEIITSGNYAFGYQGGAYPAVRTFAFNLKLKF